MIDGFWDEQEKKYYDGKIYIKQFKPGNVNILSHDTFHRVELNDEKEGCWTLFIAGNHVSIPAATNWGFINRDGKGWESHTARSERLNHNKNTFNEENKD